MLRVETTEQIVGADRRMARLPDQLQHVPAQLGQAHPARRADGFGALQGVGDATAVVVVIARQGLHCSFAKLAHRSRSAIDSKDTSGDLLL